MREKIDFVIKGTDKSRDAFDSVSRNFGRINGLAAGLGLTLGAGALVGFFTHAIKSTADLNDEMIKTAQAIGTTTEQAKGNACQSRPPQKLKTSTAIAHSNGIPFGRISFGKLCDSNHSATFF